MNPDSYLVRNATTLEIAKGGLSWGDAQAWVAQQERPADFEVVEEDDRYGN